SSSASRSGAATNIGPSIPLPRMAGEGMFLSGAQHPAALDLSNPFARGLFFAQSRECLMHSLDLDTFAQRDSGIGSGKAVTLERRDAFAGFARRVEAFTHEQRAISLYQLEIEAPVRFAILLEHRTRPFGLGRLADSDHRLIESA